MNWRWFDLGPYHVLARPLPTNESWTTHRIFRGDKFIGSQLSVPTLDDCRCIERRARYEARIEREKDLRPPLPIRRGPGRPRKVEPLHLQVPVFKCAA